jgi:hypothetical protein
VAAVIALLVAWLGTASILTGGGYRPVATRDGVMIFERDATGLIALGAEGRVAAPPEVVLSVLLDYEHQQGWIKDLVRSEVLRRGEGWLEVYQRLHMPVVEDRDFVLRVTYGADGGERTLRFNALDDGPPPQQRVVRVRNYQGSWRLRAVDHGAATQATYEFAMSPGGAVPAWIGRGRAAKEVGVMFDAIRAEAERRARR